MWHLRVPAEFGKVASMSTTTAMLSNASAPVARGFAAAVNNNRANNNANRWRARA